MRIKYLSLFLGNVVRKLYANFHRASLIRKCDKIGGKESLPKKQKILFLERFCHISKSRKNLSFFLISKCGFGKALFILPRRIYKSFGIGNHFKSTLKNYIFSVEYIFNPFMLTVPTFAVRETASLGIMGEPRVPPLNPSETIVL